MFLETSLFKSMYTPLLLLHSFTRWGVLLSLVYAIFRAYRGYTLKSPFTKRETAVRYWTVTIAHIQFVIGMVLYFQSPVIHYFHNHFSEAVQGTNTAFFGIFHPLLMLTAIAVLTIGASLAKRSPSDPGKFKTLLLWFSAALLLLFISIPWPFSPFATRPFFR